MQFQWNKLPRPFFALAPMEDVTDTVFRQVVGKHGAPDVYFTEFTNTDALCSRGEKNALLRLQFTKKEHPIIAQIWGVNPKLYYESAKKILGMGCDGIDINMGCPIRNIIKGGACAALIKNQKLTQEIIHATNDGAGELPVSVKTRIGFDEIQTDEWLGFLLDQDIAALTVHGRTAKEMSLAPAHWDEIGKVVKLRDKKKVRTVIIGNGDVVDRKDGLQKSRETGVDGIMIGRGIFHNLFAFKENSATWFTLTPKEKISILKEHATLYKDTWKAGKNYPMLKKFFKIYVSGFSGASDIRVRFMDTKTPDAAIALANELLKRW